MYTILRDVEIALPTLLAEEPLWQGKFVDYEHPHVERLWRSWGEYRVSLHRIHLCQPGQSLFHPHPWPQAVRVLAGEYEMGLGFGAGAIPPPLAATVLIRPGCWYIMDHPDGWHYVQPIGQPTLSIMVTGQPWDRPTPKSDYPLRALTPDERATLLADIRTFYR